MSRPGSLLLRGQLERTGEGKGLGEPVILLRGFSTPSDTSGELFPAAFSNPNPLTAACPPSSPTFRLLLLPKPFQIPSLLQHSS